MLGRRVFWCGAWNPPKCSLQEHYFYKVKNSKFYCIIILGHSVNFIYLFSWITDSYIETYFWMNWEHKLLFQAQLLYFAQDINIKEWLPQAQICGVGLVISFLKLTLLLALAFSHQDRRKQCNRIVLSSTALYIGSGYIFCSLTQKAIEKNWPW